MIGLTQGLGGLVTLLLSAVPGGFGLLKCLVGLVVRLLQCRYVIGKCRLAQQAMALGSDQPAVSTVSSPLGEGLPGSLCRLMFVVALAIRGVQAGVVSMPALLLLEPAFLLVQLSQRSLGGGGSALQLDAGFGVGRQIVSEAAFQGVDRKSVV